MARISTRSNPTDLREIDKWRIGIGVSESSGDRYFNLAKLDLSGLDLPIDSKVICIARAGNSSQRYDMGTVGYWKRENLLLDELEQSDSIKFRVLIHPEETPQILASAENLRPENESHSESLLPMEPAELGQLIWRLDMTPEGPVLKYNNAVFPSAAGIENYVPFGALVLPEALRRVMEGIASQPEVLNDDGDPLYIWQDWLASIGADAVPKSDDAEEVKAEWCNSVVEIFCRRHNFAGRLTQELSPGGLDG